MLCGSYLMLLTPVVAFVIGGILGLLIFGLLAGTTVGLVFGFLGGIISAVVTWFVQISMIQSIDKRLLGTHDHRELK